MDGKEQSVSLSFGTTTKPTSKTAAATGATGTTTASNASLSSDVHAQHGAKDRVAGDVGK